jgi:L-threonylcarbamoyladenylate synthase
MHRMLQPERGVTQKMGEPETQILSPDAPGISRAADLLRAGELVAFPTETVYGLGADARNDTAVAQIFAAKGRPSFNPLIVHVADLASARMLANFNDTALRLADAFWPGPLTLVVPLKPNAALSPLVSAGLPTVAIRIPEHALAHALLTQFCGPVAAPSANPSGSVSPSRAQHVIDGLGGRIAAVLDGGPCPVGLESTIVGFQPDAALLRPGGLPPEIIEQCLGWNLAAATAQATPTAPGQLSSHYAPNATIRMNATTAEKDETLLGFGPVECDLNLSKSGDLVEAAASLFHALRDLDARGVAKIAVSPIPMHGLGIAINDRLTRAAAPRG